MPKPSSSRGGKRGRGGHSARGGRQNKRQESRFDERRPASAVDSPEVDGKSDDEDVSEGMFLAIIHGMH